MQQTSKRSGPPSHATKRKSRQDANSDRPQAKRMRRNSSGQKAAASADRPSRSAPEDEAEANEASVKSLSRDDLLAEIQTLGGDEEDLQLIYDASSVSDDEVEGPSQAASQSLQNELSAFASQLGFDKTDDTTPPPPIKQAVEIAGLESQKKSQVVSARVGLYKDMILDPRPDWYSAPIESLPGLVSDETASHAQAVASLKEYALELLQKDAAAYAKSSQSSSTQRFLSTIMSSGTMNDKVSALTLAVQESPLHNVRALDGLLNLASKKSRSQAIIALAAVVDLMGPGSVLPADRKLTHFHRQLPLLGALQRDLTNTWKAGAKLPTGVTPAHLVMWAYEDWLKGAYFRVVQLLELWSDDEIDYSRTRALDFISALLREKPEQESNLLKLLVIKLGDRDRKLASRSSHLLLQLQEAHPGMKDVIIRAIEHEIILRPGQSLRARYYALNTLNQTILSSKEPLVTANLLRIYFDMFSAMLKSGELGTASLAPESTPSSRGPSKQRAKPKTEITANTQDFAEKVTSAVLVGINRALPFVDGDDAILESQLDTLFKIVHSSNFNTSIQAMLLIQQLAGGRNVAADRFYRVLYESLLDPRLITSSKQAMYLNLLLRALKSDVNLRRVKAFVKRMVQVLVFQQPSFACGVLYVVSQLRSTFPALATLIEEPEEADYGAPSQGDPGLNGVVEHEQQRYDGRKRDPEYSNAHRTCLWEMMPMSRHFHPAVLAYAESVVEKDMSRQKPDLESHSLIRFLDKFAYRNPKAKEPMRGGSIMQPLQTHIEGSDLWLRSKSSMATNQSVNNAAFWVKKPDDVAVEDKFFHHYFNQVGRSTTGAKVKASIKGGQESPPDEDEVMKALTTEGDAAEEDWDLDDMDEEDDLGDMADFDMSSLSDESQGEEDVDVDLHFSDEDEEAEGGSEGEEGEEDGDAMKAAPSSAPAKRRKRGLRDLPTFASADDYADLLQQELEE